jgi:hypothetical protein
MPTSLADGGRSQEVANRRSQFGQNFSQYLNGPASPNDPFPNPISDGQRVENARARSGNTIGSGYLNPKTGELQDPDRGFGRAVLSKPQIMVPLVLGSGILAGGAFGGGFGGMLPSAAPAEISMTSSPASVAAPTASGAVTGAGAPSSMAGFGKFFSKGLDPTSLLMMGLSFLGGDEGQERQSFAGQGSADPIKALQSLLDGTNSMGRALQSRGPTRLRSSAVQKGPEPVQIPGLPFQIGGGLGVDPALADPSLLEQAMPDVGDPFGEAPRTAQPRQRKPSNNG